jgi:signal peptidase II
MPFVTKRPSPLPYLGIAAVIILLDQFTKTLVLGYVKYGERIALTSWFDLTHVYNTGAAFSLLANAGGWQRWFFTGLGLAVAAFIVYLLWRHAAQRLFATALCLVLGGALGNVIDRLWHGHVVDFLLLYYKTWHWPAFNVADSAISVGAACLIIDELRRVGRSR